jgi:uncharacterized membrane protein YphA (DoxX/SURF4 family)
MDNNMADLPEFVRWLLVMFFILGGVANIVGPRSIRDSYTRWGFPPWFRFITGLLELASALMIALPHLQRPGLLLGAAVMAAAAATLIHHREWRHLPPAAIVIVIIVVFLRQGG